MSSSFFNSKSSQGSSKMSLHASHCVQQELAKLAVDVYGVSQGRKVETKTGKKYVKVNSVFDEAVGERLYSNPALALVTINYCQRGLHLNGDISTASSLGKLDTGSTSDTPAQLSQAPGVEGLTKSLRGLINHEYLVLEIQTGDPALPVLYIGAEKRSHPITGIHVSAVPQEQIDQVFHSGVIHHTVNCGHKQFQLQTLIDILLEGNAHYSLRDANCWHYATAAAKRLIHECAHVAGTSAEEKDRLEKESKDLEANLTSKGIRNFAILLLESCGSRFIQAKD